MSFTYFFNCSPPSQSYCGPAALVASKQARVESSMRDRYDRVLGKVWALPLGCPSCGKTLDVNHAQLLTGMAGGIATMPVSNRQRIEGGMSPPRTKPGPEVGGCGPTRTRLIFANSASATDNRHNAKQLT
jgi:hypothetical protein